VSTPVDPRRYVRYEFRFSAQVNAAGQLQTCSGEDIGAGGCRVVVVFPLQRGQALRIRLRSDQVAMEISGQATVAWVSRDPPYRCGLQFSDDLAAQAMKFIHAILGPVRLTKSGS
jgi:hypothetical protein